MIVRKLHDMRSICRRQNSWLKDLRRWSECTSNEIFRMAISKTMRIIVSPIFASRGCDKKMYSRIPYLVVQNSLLNPLWNFLRMAHVYLTLFFDSVILFLGHFPCKIVQKSVNNSFSFLSEKQYQAIDFLFCYCKMFIRQFL